VKLNFLSQSTLNGYGETFQLEVYKGFLYVGHANANKGVTIVDVRNPKKPKVCGELKAYVDTKCSKVQVAGDLLMVNYEKLGDNPQRVGIAVFDLSNPMTPGEISYYHIGNKGVHRMWYTGVDQYAYLSAVPPGFRERMLVILDMKNPEKPEEVGKWWYPGLWEAGGEIPQWSPVIKPFLHHPVILGNRAYLGLWGGGMFILDITDRSKPKEISRLEWAPHEGDCTHTVLPLPDRDLLIVTDESIKDRCQEPPKRVRIVDASDEKNPKVIAKFPIPEGDFCNKGLRFGPHNIHENRPNSYISDKLIFVSYYNAGVRVVDIGNPYEPKEVASYVPEAHFGKEATQINDVYVDKQGLVYIGDRVGGGIYILECI